MYVLQGLSGLVLYQSFKSPTQQTDIFLLPPTVDYPHKNLSQSTFFLLYLPGVKKKRVSIGIGLQFCDDAPRVLFLCIFLSVCLPIPYVSVFLPSTRFMCICLIYPSISLLVFCFFFKFIYVCTYTSLSYLSIYLYVCFIYQYIYISSFVCPSA